MFRHRTVSLGYFYPVGGLTAGAEVFQCNLHMDLDLGDVLVIACDPLKVINVLESNRNPVGNGYFASLIHFQIGTPKDRSAYVMIDSKVTVPTWGRSRMGPSRMADYFDYQLGK